VIDTDLVHKTSDLDWLGEVPTGWSVRRIKRVVSRVDYGISESTQQEGRFSVLKMGHIQRGEINFSDIDFVDAVSEDLLLENGDLLYNRTNSSDEVGKAAIFRGSKLDQVTFASYLVRLRTDHHTNPHFLNYLLNCEGFLKYARKLAIPSVQQSNLNSTRYCGIMIPLPTLAEQERIAAYLDASCAAVDTAVTAKRRQLKTLDKLRKSTIHRAVTKGINPTVRMKRTKVDWIPETPEHWNVTRVKDVLEFFNTVRIPLSAAERGMMLEKTYDYYGASGVIDKVEDYLFDGSYILIAEDGANLLTRSKPLAFIATGKFWVNNHAHILKPRGDGDETYFVNLLEAQDFSLFVTGAAQPKLTMQNLGRFRLAVPKSEEQREIGAFIHEKDAEFRTLFSQIERQIETLVAYRKSLIHECVTGKRRITEREMS
jgi:type I restriction enzyme S subunit